MSDIAERYGINLYTPGKTACPRCRRQGRDNSGNNLMVYGPEQGAFCWACEFCIPSLAHMEEMGWTDDEGEEDVVTTKEKITDEENERIKKITSIDGQEYRGIRTETNKFFGVRYEYDEETGELFRQYVPTTIDGKLAGYKTRTLPKDFSYHVGVTGIDCDMVGEFRFKTHKKMVLLVGGEIKMLTAYQMLDDNRRERGKDMFDSVAVVSPTIGESGAYKQVQKRYEFFNQFEKIIVCMDSDKAGEEATEKICAVLPKGKAFVMKMRYKDADEYLTKDDERSFITDFWNAKPWTPSGIVDAATIYQEIVERAKVEKLPFPPMLKKLNKALAGGINYGYIVNILAGSGSGKSSFVNQCTAYWMSPEVSAKVGVVSIEAEAAEYGENLLSYQMGRKISLIEDREERINFVCSEEAAKAARELFFDSEGNPLLFLLDDRGDYSKLQEKIEELVVACDVRIVIIDVISDVFAGMPIEQVDLWMSWEKKMVKQYNCIIVNVAHTRKSPSNEKSASQGKFLTEESIIGSGTQYRSAGINIALQRDKTAEDEVERNTTFVHLLKSRATGITGPICELYYEVDTHRLWDKEEYMAAHPIGF